LSAHTYLATTFDQRGKSPRSADQCIFGDLCLDPTIQSSTVTFQFLYPKAWHVSPM